jgi:aspartate/methionine/tyrosine aminotransferase
LVNPPKFGQPSYDLFVKERDGILNEMKQRAVILAEGLNKIPGIQCNKVAGAMYAFPQVKLPNGRTDSEYCLSLLEETGICVVPGSGFGQLPGTCHFRTTILPPTDKIKIVVEKLHAFHVSYK